MDKVSADMPIITRICYLEVTLIGQLAVIRSLGILNAHLLPGTFTLIS